ncbi:hypothetical protein QTI66_24395 [Variovorax sp. J22R133]|uniref:hypothetical protein n=1 Tax=Variovorax brevis TaxID=3053503 RepID=UPI002578612B|nr:hypothetical protein [Variovorax sp. J22R133]MDM0115312.1 hypothetical protein [Variovorax sp. J22R133]
MQAPTSKPQAPSPGSGAKEEPEITQEESIPSDGKDEEGEKMMEKLGQERREGDKP